MFDKNKIQQILNMLGDDAIFVEELRIISGPMDGKIAWVFTSYYQEGTLQGAERYSKLFIPEAHQYMLFYPELFPVEVPNVKQIGRGQKLIQDFLNTPPKSIASSVLCTGYGIDLGKEFWMRNLNLDLKGNFYIQYHSVKSDGEIHSRFCYFPAIDDFDCVISYGGIGGL